MARPRPRCPVRRIWPSARMPRTMPAMAPITVMPSSPRISDATANPLALPGALARRPGPPGPRRATGARALPGERVPRAEQIAGVVRGLRAGRSRGVGLRRGAAQGRRLRPGEIARPRRRIAGAGSEVARPRGIGGSAAERARPGLNARSAPPGTPRSRRPGSRRSRRRGRGRPWQAGHSAGAVRNAVVNPELPARGRGRPGRIGLPVGRRHEPRWRRRPAGGRVETQSQRASLGEVSAWVTRYTSKRPPSAEHSSQSAAEV